MGWLLGQNIQLEIRAEKKQENGARKGLTLSHADQVRPAGCQRGRARETE
jgi:hypothetical protein